MIEYTDQVCDVSPLTSEYEPMRYIPVVKTATAYDHPYDHETYILVTAQSLYFGDKLENTLLCPNQMRSHGIEVDDVPRHLSIDGKSSHFIYIPAENVRLPLLLHGCIILPKNFLVVPKLLPPFLLYSTYRKSTQVSPITMAYQADADSDLLTSLPDPAT